MQVRDTGMQNSKVHWWNFDIVDYLYIPAILQSCVAALPNNFNTVGLKKFVILRLLLIMVHPAPDGVQISEFECLGCKFVTMEMQYSEEDSWSFDIVDLPTHTSAFSVVRLLMWQLGMPTQIFSKLEN